MGVIIKRTKKYSFLVAFDCKNFKCFLLCNTIMFFPDCDFIITLRFSFVNNYFLFENNIFYTM
ncbi:hypothetical protein CHK_1330 [Christensenella hongkongensis]|uniref:Uncharacterized protein n=1 Tax=Christensenella hongkongensis TaxID=270498 RepID=A0A0M2NFJ3_9FIRM|nr:hypothetical protein CHK_1330 [Christensenella hongkongensis]